MHNSLKLLFTLTLLLAFPSAIFAQATDDFTNKLHKLSNSAETKVEKPVEEAQKKIEFVYDKDVCKKAADGIGEDIKGFTSCWKNEDCQPYDFGYPWQTHECIKTIISVTEKEKIIHTLGNIDVYKEACINTNKDEKKKYEELQKKLESARCTPVPFVCLKGVCRTGTFAIIDGDRSNKIKTEEEDDKNDPANR